jgi:hypothetical protein
MTHRLPGIFSQCKQTPTPRECEIKSSRWIPAAPVCKRYLHIHMYLHIKGWCAKITAANSSMRFVVIAKRTCAASLFHYKCNAAYYFTSSNWFLGALTPHFLSL